MLLKIFFHVLGLSSELLEYIEENQKYHFGIFVKMFKINIRKKIN